MKGNVPPGSFVILVASQMTIPETVEKKHQLSELDFQIFDAKMMKIAPTISFPPQISSKIVSNFFLNDSPEFLKFQKFRIRSSNMRNYFSTRLSGFMRCELLLTF